MSDLESRAPHPSTFDISMSSSAFFSWRSRKRESPACNAPLSPRAAMTATRCRTAADRSLTRNAGSTFTHRPFTTRWPVCVVQGPIVSLWWKSLTAKNGRSGTSPTTVIRYDAPAIPHRRSAILPAMGTGSDSPRRVLWPGERNDNQSRQRPVGSTQYRTADHGLSNRFGSDWPRLFCDRHRVHLQLARRP